MTTEGKNFTSEILKDIQSAQSKINEILSERKPKELDKKTIRENIKKELREIAKLVKKDHTKNIYYSFKPKFRTDKNHTIEAVITMGMLKTSQNDVYIKELKDILETILKRVELDKKISAEGLETGFKNEYDPGVKISVTNDPKTLLLLRFAKLNHIAKKIHAGNIHSIAQLDEEQREVLTKILGHKINDYNPKREIKRQEAEIKSIHQRNRGIGI